MLGCGAIGNRCPNLSRGYASTAPKLPCSTAVSPSKWRDRQPWSYTCRWAWRVVQERALRGLDWDRQGFSV
jgi:hypothetical protein